MLLTGIVHVVFASRRGLLPAIPSLLYFLAKEFAKAPRLYPASPGPVSK
jgi:hypothetical protein